MTAKKTKLPHGIYLFNKPVGISSAGFLNALKKEYECDKIGHGGTLDPFASGVLVVGIGREYTKRLFKQLCEAQKEYRATIVLGASSSTDDKTGDIRQGGDCSSLTLEKLSATLEELQKKTTQRAPDFCAKKIQGVPAYAHARAGKAVTLKEHPVTLFSHTLSSFEKQPDGTVHITLTIKVSAGFYVRSFARDLGEMLGVGGYVKELQRTKTGDFDSSLALDAARLETTIESRLTLWGAVQGVGLRVFAQKTAQKRAIMGSIRNNNDGSVEVTAQGNLGVLNEFLEDIRKGNEYLKIEKEEVVFYRPKEQFFSFEIE